MRLDENIGLAKVSKDDQATVNQTYASAIRDLEKAEKKKAEFTKRQAEPKHDEKPKNPKMVSGAKKMHLDESLFEDSNENLTEARVGKTKEVKVLQGNYGYGWDDLIEYDVADFNGDLLAMNRNIKQDLKDYRENETNASHRVVTRRVARELKEDKEEDIDTHESDLYEKKEKTKEQILDDLYDELRRAKYLVNADPVGYRIGKKQPKGQVQLSRKDKSYEFIKDEKDLDDAKAIVDKYGFKYYVKSTLGVPSLYIDTESLEEEAYSAPSVAGGEMVFDIKDDGSVIIYDNGKVTAESKTNPDYLRKVLKDMGFKEKQSCDACMVNEKIYSGQHSELDQFIDRLNKYMYDLTDVLQIERPSDPFTVEDVAEATVGAAAFDEDADQLMQTFSDDVVKNQELIRLIQENRWLKNNFEYAQEIAYGVMNENKLKEDFEDFYAQFDIRPERKIKEVYAEISPEEFQLDKIHSTKTIADIWSEMQAGEDFYRVASEDGEGFDSAVRESIFEIISKAFKIPYDTVYMTWRKGGKLEETFKVIDKDGKKVPQGGGFTSKKEAEMFATQYGEKDLKVVKESFEDEHLGSTEKTIDDAGEIIPDSVNPGPDAGLATELNKLIRDE